MRVVALAFALIAAAPNGLAAQQPSGLLLAGLWQLEKGNLNTDGPRTVMIRTDSSASWGKETVRWRLRPDSIMIALGGEWETYRLKVKNDRLSLSGGDLTQTITLRRVGPATPRPPGVPVPPDPNTEPPPR
ncbi:MAG TPA: hypothetical protein VGQ17_18580 [Gemmatimonadales bacterium]|nr:hypothetical protein [Gemmatimonadales bacterium]